jgi:hypothetical protein
MIKKKENKITKPQVKTALEFLKLNKKFIIITLLQSTIHSIRKLVLLVKNLVSIGDSN